MKAIRLQQPGRPLVAENLAMPEPGAHDVLVRVRAAGICHSDQHYRAGVAPTRLPCTLGHEVAGTVEACGNLVTGFSAGDRVCLNYLVTCGECGYCRAGQEPFCVRGEMIGKHRDGGFAEFVCVPERGVLPLPASIPFEQGAIMMCSSATALHALNQARVAAGDTVAVFGVGGLGVSAIQLARLRGVQTVYAVDLHPRKLALAGALGAIPVNARADDPVAVIRRLTDGRGVDAALELIGLPLTMQQAIRSLAVHGRAALAGLTDRPLSFSPYHDLLNREAEVIGVSDHLATELRQLIGFVERGQLDLSAVVTQTIPLDAAAINVVLDELAACGGDVRTVVSPG
ncbi:MAG TPA: zinc-binding dehydrogenase [Steroidobacteraceae bacterium]|nr:zinc-binding dehydrogenase [Steroidobacteraceae bacterium]